MGSLLVHMKTGVEDPTTAVLGFLVASEALAEGNQVSLFLGGNATELISDRVLDQLEGHGTGRLRDHFNAIVNQGGQIFVCSMSAYARGVQPDALVGKPAVFGLAPELIKLTFAADRVLVY